jgi:hypothetical protein
MWPVANNGQKLISKKNRFDNLALKTLWKKAISDFAVDNISR